MELVSRIRPKILRSQVEELTFGMRSRVRKARTSALVHRVCRPGMEHLVTWRLEPTSDLAVIVAPGQGIAELNDKQLAFIASKDVFGMNFSGLFPLQYKGYFFEVADMSAVGRRQVSLVERISRDGTTVWFKNVWSRRYESPVVLADLIRENNFNILKDYHLPSLPESRRNLRRLCAILQRHPDSEQGFVSQMCSSLNTIICLCKAWGYKAVLLVGTDLVGDYFFNAYPNAVPEHLVPLIPPQATPASGHSTNVGYYSVTRIIGTLRDSMSADGFNMYIYRKDVALSSVLPFMAF